MNPYSVLDVSPDAPKSTIRSAYRKQSKVVHPDMPGGSKEDFDELTRAYDCLIDDERRARYDATGDVTGAAPDLTETNALNVAFTAIAAALDNIDYLNLAGKDPMSSAIETVSRLRADGERDLSQKETAVKKIEKYAARFVAKEGKPNKIAPMLLSRAQAIRNDIETAKRALDVQTRAIAILKDHEYTADRSGGRIDDHRTRLQTFANATAGV